MTKISMTVINVASKKRPILGHAEAEIALSPVEIAEALYGSVSCFKNKDGSRKWFGRKNIYGFHSEEAPMLADFIEANNLVELEKVSVPMEKSGSYESKRLQVMHYIEYGD